MSLAFTVSDTLVLARRNLKRIPRQPDLLVAYTIQPVMFVLLFVYVFGGAIQTPGFDYVDFLMPGIIVQSIAFGGFVTALGLSEDVQKGLIDRFRSLPTSRAAVLTGRTLSDVVLNCLSLAVLLGVGFVAAGRHGRVDGVRVVRGAARDLRAARGAPLQAGRRQIGDPRDGLRPCFGRLRIASRILGASWHTLWVRYRLPAAVVALIALTLVPAAPAQAPAKASAAVISGDLGRVTSKRASGGGSSSGSIPSKFPKGIGLGDGFVSVTTSKSEGTAEAQAEADGLDLFGGAITASLVLRTATANSKGVSYRGSVRDLVVDEREIGSVESRKTYTFDSGKVVVNDGGAGLTVTLTDDFNGFPAGTKVVVADVSASAGAAAPEPTATATVTPQPTATATPTATPKPRDTTPSWKKRLMSKRFVFPVGGPTRIGGPFGAYRAQGAHQGNDLFANFGTPVVAVADGVVKNVGSLPISGNRLWVYADGGDQFFYAHLASFAPAAVNDRHVEAGTILGYTGNTGDAEPTPPHLHFEIHPDGGDAVDPNPFLVAWQKRAGAALTDTAERPGALVEVRDFIGEG